MSRIALFLICSLFLLTSLQAGQEDDLFEQANIAYQYNDFDKAISLYTQVVDMGFRSVELEYNLGNAYYKKDEKAKAILHYERALLLSPDDVDVVYNLKLVKKEMEVRDALPDFFLLAWWKNMRALLTVGAWTIVGLVLWWIGFGGLCLWLKGKTRGQRKRGFIGGLALVVLSLLPFALAFNRMAYQEDSGHAIVMTKTAELKSAPDEVGVVKFQLYEGEKVEMMEYLGGYWQVTLANGDKGWVNEKELEEI